MENINEHIIKITGSFCITADQAPRIGDDLTIAIQGSVVKTEDSDNQDGTINRLYKVKMADGRVGKE